MVEEVLEMSDIKLKEELTKKKEKKTSFSAQHWTELQC